MTILCLPRPRDWVSRFLKTCAAARPSFKAVSAVTGSRFAVPRTPSVPKILLGELIKRSSIFRRGGYDADAVGLDADDRDAGRHGDVHALFIRVDGAGIGQIHRCVDLVGLQFADGVG